LEGMMNVVRRTGHSSFYVEKGMGAVGKSAKQAHIGSEFRIQGGGQYHLFTALLISSSIAFFPIFSVMCC
jgi:hypothetical protein